MNLFNDYTALDNVLVALPEVRRARVRRAGAISPRDSAAQDKAAAVLARVGLARQGADAARRACPTASGARWRSASRSPREPRLLFLDEPTAGLGAEGTARLAELIARAEARR